VANLLRSVRELEDIANLPFLSKVKVLHDLRKATEIIDGCIKSMKGHPEYTQDEKLKQVKMFYTMLSSYHDMMNEVIKFIPESEAKKIKGGLNERVNEINKQFSSKSNSKDQMELSTSGNFSVNSSTIDSPADFNRQFTNRANLGEVMLEDFFTLFHQNILSAISLIGPEINLLNEVLPPKLKKFDTWEDIANVYLKLWGK